MKRLYLTVEGQTEQAFAVDVLQPYLSIPYLQVHEFEALVLADVNCFLEWFENVEDQVELLRTECEAFADPERINHGRQTHPKARIKKYIFDYDENVDGPVLAEYIGIEAIKKECSHFSEWMSILEQLDANDEQ